DDGEWDRLCEVFADDVVFDVTDYGYGTLHGLHALPGLVRGSWDRRTSRSDIASPMSSWSARTTETRGQGSAHSMPPTATPEFSIRSPRRAMT
ncbi:MAG: hypothetical protein J2P17_19365, partial [Mycobacterium sp.]|nr:hypothetical protein [Mycobacterium sp.]